jgi:hypothetical protein
MTTETFHPAQLASKQKRLREWNKFLETNNLSEDTAKNLKVKLSQYGNLLVSYFNNQDEKTVHQIKNLERELESLNEFIRLNYTKTLDR